MTTITHKEIYDLSYEYISTLLNKYEIIINRVIQNYKSYINNSHLINFLIPYATEIDNIYNINNGLPSIEYEVNKYHPSFLDDIYYIILVKHTKNWINISMEEKMTIAHDAWVIHYLYQLTLDSKNNLIIKSKGQNDPPDNNEIFTIDGVCYYINKERLYNKQQFLPYHLLSNEQQELDRTPVRISKKYYSKIVNLPL